MSLKKSGGYQVLAKFSIELHKKDLLLLKQIQKFFNGIGTITLNKNRNSAVFRVFKLKDLTNIVIPHFRKYPLITQKRADYLLFKQAFDLIKCKQHLTIEGLLKIVSIRASMNNGLTKELKAAFPDVIPAARPSVGDIEIKDPQWLAGFVTAGGCFMIK